MKFIVKEIDDDSNKYDQHPDQNNIFSCFTAHETKLQSFNAWTRVLNRIPGDEECDATGADSSIEAKSIIIIGKKYSKKY